MTVCPSQQVQVRPTSGTCGLLGIAVVGPSQYPAAVLCTTACIGQSAQQFGPVAPPAAQNPLCCWPCAHVGSPRGPPYTSSRPRPCYVCLLAPCCSQGDLSWSRLLAHAQNSSLDMGTHLRVALVAQQVEGTAAASLVSATLTRLLSGIRVQVGGVHAWDPSTTPPLVWLVLSLLHSRIVFTSAAQHQAGATQCLLDRPDPGMRGL